MIANVVGLFLLAICRATSALIWDVTVTNPDGSTSGITRDFAVCLPTLKNQTGVKSSMPGRVVPAADLRWCTINCQDDSSCVGFDFDKTVPHCELHTVQNFNSDAQSSSNIQYTITNICATVCHPSWDTVTNQAGTGGITVKEILASNKSALVGCLEYCARRVDHCVGIEFTPEPKDPEGDVCKYFPNSMGKSHTAHKTTQFTMHAPCAESCAAIWVEYDGQNFNGLVETSNSTQSKNLDQCNNECVNSPTCVVYSVPADNTSPFFCQMSNYYGTNITDPTLNTVIWTSSCALLNIGTGG